MIRVATSDANQHWKTSANSSSTYSPGVQWLWPHPLITQLTMVRALLQTAISSSARNGAPTRGGSDFFTCERRESANQSHSIASQNSRHVHGVLCVCFPPPSSLPSCSFLLVQDLSSKWIVLTDNVTKIAWRVYSSLMPSPTRTSWWETVWRTKSNFLDLFPKCGKEGLIRLWYYVALPLQQLISTWVSVCTFFERVGVNCFQCC